MNYVLAPSLSDAEWHRIEPLLPPQKPRTGRPAHDHRRIVSGILWVQRTGYPWRSMPPKFGHWSTVASRYHRWRKAGVWQQVEQALEEVSCKPVPIPRDGGGMQVGARADALTEEAFAAQYSRQLTWRAG
jgi:transposase